jgi:MFS family permease
MKPVFVSAILLLVLAELGLLSLQGSIAGLALSLLLFFVAFNLLEASLPSLIAKQSPTDRKGTAMGVYSSSQFLGIFVGGALGGFLYGHWMANGVFLFGAGILLLWLVLAVSMESPRYLASYVLNIGVINPAEADHLATRIGGVRGVSEVTVIAEEESAYLKVDNEQLDIDALNEFSINRA